LLKGIYFDDIWVVRQYLTHSELFLSTVDLVGILVRFKDLDADELLLAVVYTLG
jgi:hypothetical protein